MDAPHAQTTKLPESKIFPSFAEMTHHHRSYQVRLFLSELLAVDLSQKGVYIHTGCLVGDALRYYTSTV